MISEKNTENGVTMLLIISTVPITGAAITEAFDKRTHAQDTREKEGRQTDKKELEMVVLLLYDVSFR